MGEEGKCGTDGGGGGELLASLCIAYDPVIGRELVQVRSMMNRKRPVGETERKNRQKSVWIEEALRAGDKDRLCQLAVSEGGLLTDEVRKLPVSVSLSGVVCRSG